MCRVACAPGLTGRSTRTRSGIAPRGVLVSVRLAAQCRCAPVCSEVRRTSRLTMGIDIKSFVHGVACSSYEFDEAAIALGHALPFELTRIYEIANGFRGPTNAAFLYPLLHAQPFNQET